MRRQFSEEEAAELLRRAAQLQDASGRSSTSGLDFAELQRIATEAGIATEFLEEAMRRPLEKRQETAWGFGQGYSYEIPGLLSDHDVQSLESELASLTKVSLAQQIGFTRRLTVTKDMIHATVQISRKGERTVVSFRYVPFVAYFAGLHGPLLLGLIFTLIGFTRAGAQWMQLVGPLVLVLGFGLFWIFNSLGRKQADTLWSNLVEKLNQLAPSPQLRASRSSAAVLEDESQDVTA